MHLEALNGDVTHRMFTLVGSLGTEYGVQPA